MDQVVELTINMLICTLTIIFALALFVSGERKTLEKNIKDYIDKKLDKK